MLPITIGKTYFMTFQIIPKLRSKIILGRDFIHMYSVRQTDDRTYTAKAQITGASPDDLAQINHQHRLLEMSSGTSKTIRHITIPAGRRQIIPVKTTRIKNNRTVLAEPVKSLSERHHVMGSTCILEVNQGRACYELFNPFSTDVTLKPIQQWHGSG
jgi:hypothetical protein